MNSEQQTDPQNTSQATTAEAYSQPLEDMAETVQLPKKSHKLRNIIVGSVLVLVAAIVYVVGFYIPNLPENVFKSAAADFVTKGGNYSITGRIDQSDQNAADYDFTITASGNDSFLFDLTATTSVLKPKVTLEAIGGKTYVQFYGFETSKKLAEHYSNNGQPGLQEQIALLTDATGIYTHQNEWLELGDYVLNSPTGRAPSDPASIESGATLTKIGEPEKLGSKSVRKYEVTLSKQAFAQLAGKFDKTGYLANNLDASEVKLNVWVNTDTKSVESANIDGLALNDATLRVNLNAVDTNDLETPQAKKLTSVMDFGIVNSQIFNQQFEPLSDQVDRERVADLKGIKTALEIFKAKNGHYPSREDIATKQDKFVASEMRGADLEIFKDPNGAFVGQSGSQYAYVPASDKDEEECGAAAKLCQKFFIVTTLQNGTKYQLNSD